MQSKIVPIFICCVVFFINSCVNAGTLNNEGYRDVIVCDDNFIAVGTSGRIDLISFSGEITHLESSELLNLNSVVFSDGKVVVVGDKGTILVSEDRQVFKIADSGISENINSLTVFNNEIIAAADKGIILIGNEANQWDEIQLPLKGDIVSVSAGISYCFGVTNKGEIISSTDAINWKIFDYNTEYKGFAEPCIFKDILVSNNWITIVGHYENNTPISLFSSKGSVWTERSLDYSDSEGIHQFFSDIPNDNAYNPLSDEFFIVCDNGSISILPSCHKCNKALTLTDKNLKALAFSENTMVIVGDDFYVNTIKTDSLF